MNVNVKMHTISFTDGSSEDQGNVLYQTLDFFLKHTSTFVHFVEFYTVFTHSFCDLSCFVAIYELLCGEKFEKNTYVERKMTNIRYG